MNIHCIANPTSRSGKGKNTWAFWQETLCRQPVTFTWHETASGADCREKAAKVQGIAVAVGGDGTINNVLQGVMSCGAKASLGVLYAGTSPDFCRFHAIPTQPGAALATLLAGHTRAVDVAAITYAGAEDDPCQGYFACSCNIGLGAAVARFANTWRRYFGDTLGTALGLIRAILQHKTFTCTLVCDGEERSFSHVNHVLLLKNPHIASSLRLAANITSDDGQMITVVMHGRSRWQLLGLIKAMYSGTLLTKPGVFAKPCTHVSVCASPCQEVEFDGDPHGQTPVDVTILPRALSLICGRPS